jgi:hypothetical protein
MDAGVIIRCRPQAFAGRTAAENFLNQSSAPAEMAGKFSAAGRNATAAADSRVGPSAASSLLDDALGHRRRRASLHLTPRCS